MRFTIRELLLVGVIVAMGVARAEEPGPTLKELISEAELSKEPFSPPMAVKYYLERHVPSHGARHRMLVITWFVGKPHYALCYEVSPTGFASDVRDVYSHAHQAGHESQLPEDKFNLLKSLLSKLPGSKAEPPIERTVYVSFQDGDKWRSETYDATSLPGEFERVIALCGERFETRDRHKKKAAQVP